MATYGNADFTEPALREMLSKIQTAFGAFDESKVVPGRSKDITFPNGFRIHFEKLLECSKERVLDLPADDDDSCWHVVFERAKWRDYHIYTVEEFYTASTEEIQFRVVEFLKRNKFLLAPLEEKDTAQILPMEKIPFPEKNLCRHPGLRLGFARRYPNLESLREELRVRSGGSDIHLEERKVETYDRECDDDEDSPRFWWVPATEWVLAIDSIDGPAIIRAYSVGPRSEDRWVTIKEIHVSPQETKDLVFDNVCNRVKKRAENIREMVSKDTGRYYSTAQWPVDPLYDGRE